MADCPLVVFFKVETDWEGYFDRFIKNERIARRGVVISDAPVT